MNSKLLNILFFNRLFCLCSGNILLQEVLSYQNVTEAKAEYAYEVVSRVHNTFRQWFFTIIFCEFTYFENRILKYTETYSHGYPVMLLDGCPRKNTSKVKPRINKHGDTAYIITSNSLSIDANEFSIQILETTGVFNPRKPVIFVINEPLMVDDYFHYEMKTHFDLLWSRIITNSVLIVWSGRMRVYAYNHFLDTIMDVTDEKNLGDLLTNLYDNMYGHELRLSVYKNRYMKDLEPDDCNSSLAKAIFNRLNATCKDVLPRDGKTVGEVFSNGSMSGITADLYEGYTDLELSPRILKNVDYGYIDTTYPLIQDKMCFLVKKAERQSTFVTTIQLISPLLMIGFIMNIFILISVAVIAFKTEQIILKTEHRRTALETAVDLVKCLLRQTVDITFLGPVYRIVVAVILLYSLIIDCAIDGIVTSAITYPRFKADINTIEEMIEKNLTIAVHQRNLRLLEQSLSLYQTDALKGKIEVVNDMQTNDIIEKRQFNYAILLRSFDTRAISRKQSNIVNGRPIYHTMMECPIPCWIVFGQRYGSPYTKKFNLILLRLNEGGILQHWLKKEEYNLLEKKNKFLHGENNKIKRPLAFENISEVLIVWCVGLCIGLIVFIAEILIHRYITEN